MSTKLQDNIRNLLDLKAEVPGVETPRSAREPKPKYHGDHCFCQQCADIRAAMINYLEAKKLFDINGF